MFEMDDEMGRRPRVLWVIGVLTVFDAPLSFLGLFGDLGSFLGVTLAFLFGEGEVSGSYSGV